MNAHLFTSDIDYIEFSYTPHELAAQDAIENDKVPEHFIRHMLDKYYEEVVEYLLDQDKVYEELVEYFKEIDVINMEP